MINIAERPAEAADRAVPGHWEGDLIIGADCRVRDRDPGRAHHRVRDAAAPARRPHRGHRRRRDERQIGRLPEQLRRSLTWDQGSEMALHTEITGRPAADLLLRPPQPLAARHEREHQRAAAPVLPQGHRPVVLRARPARPGRRRTQRPPPQTPRLRNPRRRPRTTTIPATRICCIDSLNPSA